MEDFCCPGLAIADSSICALYSAGVTTGLVIDVGYKRTGITPVFDGSIIEPAQMSIPYGSHQMLNDFITRCSAERPRFDSENGPEIPSDPGIYEQIRRSPISECFPETKNIVKGLQETETPDEDKAGVDDIAQILASGKMQQYVEQKETERAARKSKYGVVDNNAKEKKEQSNIDLAFNKMELKDRRMVVIGKARFEVGTDLLFGGQDHVGLLDAIGYVVEMISLTEFSDRKTELWQNIVLVGGGARIHGNMIERVLE